MTDPAAGTRTIEVDTDMYDLALAENHIRPGRGAAVENPETLMPGAMAGWG
jgi:hypothetical protein